MIPSDSVNRTNGSMSVLNVQDVYDYASRNIHVQLSIDVIEECLRQCSFDVTKFCISFNGGKDCTVLLHLLHVVLMKHRMSNPSKDEMRALYIQVPDTFPELKDFVELTVERYSLKLLAFDGPDFKKALAELKLDPNGEQIEFILMGMRASDLSYTLATFQMTDTDWPQFMRVSPILSWSYAEVWSFLRDLNVGYCSLYDKGYTSLGNKSNTALNPKLKRLSAEGETIYLPAYMLADAAFERNGRYSGKK